MIELMVAVGLTMISILSIMYLATDMQTIVSTENRFEDKIELANEVTAILDNAVTCTAQLKGSKYWKDIPISLSSEIKADGQFRGLHIDSVAFGPGFNIGTNKRRSQIIINGSIPGDATGSKVFVYTANVFYSIANTVVDECLGRNAPSPAACEALGGDWDGGNCEFCEVLGGTRDAKGACITAGGGGGAANFAWELEPWSICDSGTQTRAVTCYQWGDPPVLADPSKCYQPPPPASRTCDLYLWRAGPWSTCDGTTQTRSVDCVNSYTGALASDPLLCTDTPPYATQACSLYEWVIDDWGLCDNMEQTRTIWCKYKPTGAKVANTFCGTHNYSTVKTCVLTPKCGPKCMISHTANTVYQKPLSAGNPGPVFITRNACTAALPANPPTYCLKCVLSSGLIRFEQLQYWGMVGDPGVSCPNPVFE